MSNTEPDNRISLSDKSFKLESWKRRKQHSIDSLSKKTKSEMLLFAADKLANLKDILADYLVNGEKVFDRFNAPKKDVKWYYLLMIPVFKRKIGTSRMFKEFYLTYNLLFKSNSK